MVKTAIYVIHIFSEDPLKVIYLMFAIETVGPFLVRKLTWRDAPWPPSGYAPETCKAICNLPPNYLTVFDHFVKLVLKGLASFTHQHMLSILQAQIWNILSLFEVEPGLRDAYKKYSVLWGWYNLPLSRHSIPGK